GRRLVGARLLPENCQSNFALLWKRVIINAGYGRSVGAGVWCSPAAARPASAPRNRRGNHMAHPGKHSDEGPGHASTPSQLARPAEQSQLDFELDFFSGILDRNPDYVDVLRVMGNNLTLKGRYAQGLQI